MLAKENGTLLMMSTFPKVDREEVVKLLLEKCGINVNLKDLDGKIALSLATINDNAAIIRLLLSHPNIDINSINSIHDSALIVAMKSNFVEIVDQLLERYTEASLQDGEGGIEVKSSWNIVRRTFTG